MPNVVMPRADWETVLLILNDAKASLRVAYIDNIIDTIDKALDSQEC